MRPSWSGGDTRRTGQGPAAERDSLRREPAMQCFRLWLTVLLAAVEGMPPEARL